MKRRLATAVITILAAGVASGCGGSGDGRDGGDGDAAAPTKAQFIARADAICAATETRIKASAAKLRKDSEQSGTLPKQRVAKFFKESSLPAYERMLAQLRDLTPPKGDEKDVNGFVGALAAAIDAVKANPIRYASRTVPDPFTDANQRALAYGMKECGS